jgi:hypothetical protein
LRLEPGSVISPFGRHVGIVTLTRLRIDYGPW